MFDTTQIDKVINSVKKVNYSIPNFRGVFKIDVYTSKKKEIFVIFYNFKREYLITL